MSLSLRRFEVLVVAFVAFGILGALTAAWWGPVVEQAGSVVSLIPAPVVLNEKEAILRQVSMSSERVDLSEEERLAVLRSLEEVATGTRSGPAPTIEERLQVLEELSRNR